MLQSLRNFWNHERVRQLTDVRNIALYIFALVVLAITWSGVKTVQVNYELQKKISALNQQNEVLKLQNENAALQNQYLQSDDYLELAARRDFGLAAPGEKVILIPKAVALKHVDQSIAPSPNEVTTAVVPDDRPQYIKNIEAWRDFLLGRQVFND